MELDTEAYAAKLRTLTDDELRDEHANAEAAIGDEPAAAMATAMARGEMLRRRPTLRLVRTCRRCGRNEGDDIGVVIDGVCADCRRADQ